MLIRLYMISWLSESRTLTDGEKYINKMQLTNITKELKAL